MQQKFHNFSVVCCGAWLPGNRTRDALSIPQSAFADSSLCTREPSLPFCIEPAQRGSAVWVQRHAGPAWGAKKVGEVPCRDSHILFGPVSGRPYSLCLGGHNRPSFCCPARQRSMGAAARRYFVLRRTNTLPRPKIPVWGCWSSSPQRRLWLLGGANLGRWEIKCSWAHRGVSP